MESMNRAEDRAANAEIREDIAMAQRDAAMIAAAGESARGDVAVNAAIDATIEANRARAAAREMATERNILGAELASERAASANNAFGFYLMVGLIVAALIVAGFYLYWQPYQPESVSVFAAPPPQPAPTVIATPPPPTTIPAPVIVTPRTPDVHNNINVTPPAPNPSSNGGETGPEGSNGSGESQPPSKSPGDSGTQ